jgi:glycerol-3-phosphate dehydrogenase
VEDVLWRRTKHGLRLNDEQKRALSQYIEGKVASLQELSEMREIA